MSETPLCRFEVSCKHEENISVSAIIRAPRTYKPQDLLAACNNLLGTQLKETIFPLSL